MNDSDTQTTTEAPELVTALTATPTPAPSVAKKWTSTAGPIQTNKVNKAFGSLRMEHGHVIEKTGIIGVSEDSHGYYIIFGGHREDVAAAQIALGEEFGWTVTRENYSHILVRAAAVLAELQKNAPVKDKRITPEQHAKDEAERAEWKRKQIENLAKLRGTSPEFQATIKRLSDLTNKTEDGIYGWWLEYSANCTAGDMSPVLGEFVEHYRAKLGSYPEALQRALIAPEVPKGVSVRYNSQHNGVEVRHDSKPEQSVISQLKASGFRWSRGQGVWYKKFGSYAWAQAHRITGLELAPEPKIERSEGHDGGMSQAQEDAFHDNQARAMGL